MPLQTLFPLHKTLVFLFSTWQTSPPLRLSSKITTTAPCSSPSSDLGRSLSVMLGVCSQGLDSSPLLFPCDLIHLYAFSYHLCIDCMSDDHSGECRQQKNPRESLVRRGKKETEAVSLILIHFLLWYQVDLGSSIASASFPINVPSVHSFSLFYPSFSCL